MVLMMTGFVGMIFGQEIADSSATIVYNFGDSIMEFLTQNAWTIAWALFFVASEWLGKTGKVKEGSVYAWILNLIGSIIKKKGTVVKTQKAKFMNNDELKAVRG